MQTLKKKIKSGVKPLQQLNCRKNATECCRYAERRAISENIKNNRCQSSKKHGPIKVQYKIKNSRPMIPSSK